MNETASRASAKCPSCNSRPILARRTLPSRQLSMLECPQCAGMWVSLETLHRILELKADGVTGAQGEPKEAVQSSVGLTEDVPQATRGYRACVECGGLMQRRSFGRGVQRVMLDVCGRHGIWFDADEYEQLLALAGGEEREVTRDELAQLANAPDKVRQRRVRQRETESKAAESNAAARSSAGRELVDDDSAVSRSLNVFCNLTTCGDLVWAIVTAWF